MSDNNKLPDRVPKGSPEGGQFTNTADKTADELKTDLQQQVNDNPLIVKSASKQMIRDFVQRVQNGQVKDGEVCELGEITDRARADIERLTGQKLNATKHVISATELTHIWNRHGEFGLADHSMSTMEDFEDIVDVLQNYDNISLSNEKSNFRNGQGENAPIILYTKKLNNGTQIVAEAVTDGKKGKLRVISAYKAQLQK